ncbi:hypothetical protein B0A52_01535 [Exophiala mesophila]|uniref:PWWP domain-containing protein n=1 Tax=Exophiala mesophila TaxID=212818 RepID=A0A438NF97_EXOME|nr:hypothetical protein B0A52_01535 [Exophiala mesophila]
MADTAPPQSEAPVQAAAADTEAPPSLAAPASAPATEMSGALPTETTENKPTQEPESAVPNGAQDPTPSAPTEAEAPAPSTAPTAPAADPEPKSDEPADAPAPETNGTPANKKAATTKRQSMSENKGKKLNKKKSAAKLTNLDAQPGEYYIARLKSYPPWPSIICDEEMLPDVLLNSRPVTTKKADGTYNEAYADGGKKVTERTFPIMFLHTNEFAWIPNTDLAPLNPEDCKDVSEKGKGKALLAAYEVAAENHDLEYFKTVLDEHAAAIQADEDARLAREAEKAEKASKASEKKKRKSEAKVEDVEMADADADAAPKKPSKKRKKDAVSEDDDTEKPAKTPKTEEKKAKEKAAKAKPERRKSKAAAAAPASDEEMVDAEPEPEEKPLDPAEARKARDKEVLFLRHKLQKGFLTRDQAPREEEMPQMSTYIKKLEGYTDLEMSIIRSTKINKVLKGLIKLNTIPRDEEFHFRQRSVDLLSQWNKFLGAEPVDTEGQATSDKDAKATPTTNGVHDKSEEPTEEKKAESPSQDGQVDTPAAAETTTETEKPAEPAPPVAEPAPEPVMTEKPDTVSSEEPKATLPAPEVVEKAPESAAAAGEAAEVVKASE